MGKEKIRTREVLQLIGVLGIIVATAAIPSLPMALGAVVKVWKNVNRKDLGKIIKRLEKQEMISIRENGEQITIEITDRGKRRLLEYDFENIQLKSQKRDGKWRLVIFDIPEDKKSAREIFRKKLLQLGLIRLQDSVFVSAFPCKKEVDFLCHYLGISDFITLLSIDRIERGEELIFKRFTFGDNQ
ncbi:CRISPR-associated endonuclease Cas2 [Candidatus Daviesbacteria bacterium]|nr:CRISPR-associated endonuclease Cas2 [Candidatus Daviesbacteria bacterium]